MSIATDDTTLSMLAHVKVRDAAARERLAY
jgi:hypothetical protein